MSKAREMLIYYYNIALRCLLDSTALASKKILSDTLSRSETVPNKVNAFRFLDYGVSYIEKLKGQNKGINNKNEDSFFQEKFITIEETDTTEKEISK
ncbi:hypothetical protein QEN19_000499 [Hanseniaspora menglaensis]